MVFGSREEAEKAATEIDISNIDTELWSDVSWEKRQEDKEERICEAHGNQVLIETIILMEADQQENLYRQIIIGKKNEVVIMKFNDKYILMTDKVPFKGDRPIHSSHPVCKQLSVIEKGFAVLVGGYQNLKRFRTRTDVLQGALT